MVLVNGYDDFLKSIPSSKYDIKDIDVVLSPSGDFRQLKNENATLKRIYNHLLTKKGTYIFDPEYGADILQYLFEPADNSTYDRITNTVSNVVDQNKGNEDISFEVLFMKNGKGFVINMVLTRKYGLDEKINIVVDMNMMREDD